ncbi:hypothetical protein DIPPA_63898 [Diplonema papillatum]|nr:hypothetical protein DIPPA_63897 [Diplonema papillatum]KAJ9437469.1 hypothetical protein DIPPA_63898 [Diplonema papillatum]
MTALALLPIGSRRYRPKSKSYKSSSMSGDTYTASPPREDYHGSVPQPFANASAGLPQDVVVEAQTEVNNLVQQQNALSETLQNLNLLSDVTPVALQKFLPRGVFNSWTDSDCKEPYTTIKAAVAIRYVSQHIKHFLVVSFFLLFMPLLLTHTTTLH